MKKNNNGSKDLYVDGFVFAVPRKNLAAYKKIASEAGKVWMKHGALEYKECIGDDMNDNMAAKNGATFPKMTRLKDDELVGFSYIVYESKKHRNEVNKKVMQDPFMNDPKMKDKPMPFDMKRMSYGGFKTIVSL